MNTEQAIEFFEGCKHHCGNPEFIDMAISALREKQERENPKPLTLAQLRERGGKPVYIVEHPEWGHWELSVDAEDYIEDRDPDFYGMTCDGRKSYWCDSERCKTGLHQLGWLAYDYPPKEAQA